MALSCCFTLDLFFSNLRITFFSNCNKTNVILHHVKCFSMTLRMFWLETLLYRASVEMQQRQFYCKLEPNANTIFLITTMDALNLIRDLHTIFSSRKKNTEAIVFGLSNCSF